MKNIALLMLLLVLLVCSSANVTNPPQRVNLTATSSKLTFLKPNAKAGFVLEPIGSNDGQTYIQIVYENGKHMLTVYDRTNDELTVSKREVELQKAIPTEMYFEFVGNRGSYASIQPSVKRIILKFKTRKGSQSESFMMMMYDNVDFTSLTVE